MQKVIVGVYALVVLLGEAIAMNDIQPPNPSSVGHIAREAPHFDAVTLRNFSLSEADTLNITNLYIEKYAYYLLSSVASLLKCSMMNNAVIVVAVLFDANVKHSEEFVEVSIGEGAYLAAISRIFSSEKPVVSEESLNDILFAAQHGNKDAELSIQLACNDSSYESAITKGEHRAKECLKNRILRTPYGLEFYRPIALDFSRIISSSFDWRKPFKHIAPNIMYLKSEGDIGYAYAAVQDVCYLFESLK